MLKRIPLFCHETGYSEKAVARKIEDGVWVEGREYVRAPDGRLLIDMDGFNRWALGEQRWAEKQKSCGGEFRKCGIRIRFTWHGKRHVEVFTSEPINERVWCKT